MAAWRIWTDEGGLTRADPGPGHPALRDAIDDCAETLSPRGRPPTLSTYWIDRVLERIEITEVGDVTNGNLWVLSVTHQTVEVRMDVDSPTSEPIESVDLSTVIEGLRALRAEVLAQLEAGHQLDESTWSQKNPG